jgi:hypothetical protein
MRSISARQTGPIGGAGAEEQIRGDPSGVIGDPKSE